MTELEKPEEKERLEEKKDETSSDYRREEQRLVSGYFQLGEHARNVFSLTPTHKELAIKRLKLMVRGKKKIRKGASMISKKPFPLKWFLIGMFALAIAFMITLNQPLDAGLAQYFSDSFRLGLVVAGIFGVALVIYLVSRKRS